MLPGLQHRLRIEGPAWPAMCRGEPVLEQHPERLEEQILRLVTVDAHQPLPRLHIDTGGCYPLVKRRERSFRKLRIVKCRAHRPVQGVATVMVSILRVRP